MVWATYRTVSAKWSGVKYRMGRVLLGTVLALFSIAPSGHGTERQGGGNVEFSQVMVKLGEIRLRHCTVCTVSAEQGDIRHCMARAK